MQLRRKAIVDGSGVLYDPAGLNRMELRRLAKQRLPVKHFDRSLLKQLGSTLPRRCRVRRCSGCARSKGLAASSLSWMTVMLFCLMDRST